MIDRSTLSNIIFSRTIMHKYNFKYYHKHLPSGITFNGIVWFGALEFLFLSVTFIVLYNKVIKSIFERWFSYNGMHSIIIFAISIYLVWIKRNKLKELSVRPSLLWGTAITCTGCILLLIGDISGVLLFQQLSIIVSLMGLVALLFGIHYLKEFLLPIAYLFFMFPLLEELLGVFSHIFQKAAAIISYYILNIFGMPAFIDGLTIQLPHISLEVAKVCSGINHITALISLSIPLGYITRKSKIGMLFLILVTFSVALFSNGLRIALIGVWTQYADSDTIHGPFSMLYASTVFLLIFILIVYFSIATGREHIKNTIVQSKSQKSFIPTNISFKHNRIAMLIAIILITLTGAYMIFLKPEPVYYDNMSNKIPLSIGDWHGVDVKSLNEKFESVIPDIEIKRIYKNSKGDVIKLYISYFAVQKQNREIVNYRYDWLLDSGKVLKIGLDDFNLRAIKSEYFDQNVRKNALFWYQIGKQRVVSRYVAKAYTFINAIIKRRTNGAIVIVLLENNSLSYLDSNGELNENIISFIRQINARLNMIFNS